MSTLLGFKLLGSLMMMIKFLWDKSLSKFWNIGLKNFENHKLGSHLGF